MAIWVQCEKLLTQHLHIIINFICQTGWQAVAHLHNQHTQSNTVIFISRLPVFWSPPREIPAVSTLNYSTLQNFIKCNLNIRKEEMFAHNYLYFKKNKFKLDTNILMPEIYTQCWWDAVWRTPVLSGPRFRQAAVCVWVYMPALKTRKLQASSLNDLASWSVEDELVLLAYQSLPRLILFSVVVILLPRILDSVLRDYLLTAASLNTDTEHNNPFYHPHQQQHHSHHYKSISTISMICLMACIIVCLAITFYHRRYHHPHPTT